MIHYNLELRVKESQITTEIIKKDIEKFFEEKLNLRRALSLKESVYVYRLLSDSNPTSYSFFSKLGYSKMKDIFDKYLRYYLKNELEFDLRNFSEAIACRLKGIVS